MAFECEITFNVFRKKAFSGSGIAFSREQEGSKEVLPAESTGGSVQVFVLLHNLDLTFPSTRHESLVISINARQRLSISGILFNETLLCGKHPYPSRLPFSATCR